MPPDRTPPVPLNCPCCGTKLRVQARLSVGRTARCPECRGEIVIVQEGDNWRVETPATQPLSHRQPKAGHRLAGASPENSAELPGALQDRAATGSAFQRAALVARRPVVVASASACALVALSLYWAFGRAPSVPAPRPPSAIPPAAIADEIPGGQPHDDKPVNSADLPIADASVPDDENLSDSSAPLRKDADNTAEPPASAFAQDSSALSTAQDDEPLAPEFAEEPAEAPRPFDIAASLRQNIESYEVSQLRKFSELLPELVELVGAPIRFEEPEPTARHPELKSLVRVQLRNTTVGAIVEAVCTAAGLAYRVEEDHLQLIPRK